jgi:hypothetical protein
MMARTVRTLRVFWYRVVTLAVWAMALLAQAYGLGQTPTLAAPVCHAVCPATEVLTAQRPLEQSFLCLQSACDSAEKSGAELPFSANSAPLH